MQRIVQNIKSGEEQDKTKRMSTLVINSDNKGPVFDKEKKQQLYKVHKLPKVESSIYSNDQVSIYNNHAAESEAANSNGNFNSLRMPENAHKSKSPLRGNNLKDQDRYVQKKQRTSRSPDQLGGIKFNSTRILQRIKNNKQLQD